MKAPARATAQEYDRNEYAALLVTYCVFFITFVCNVIHRPVYLRAIGISTDPATALVIRWEVADVR